MITSLASTNIKLIPCLLGVLSRLITKPMLYYVLLNHFNFHLSYSYYLIRVTTFPAEETYYVA